MTITIDGTTGIASVDGSAGSPSVRGSDSNSGIVYAADEVKISTGGTERAKVNSSGHFLPGAADTYDLGANTTPWRNVWMQNDLYIEDDGMAVFGTGEDLKIYHNSGGEDQIRGSGSKMEIRSPSLQLQATNGEKYLVGTENGSTALYYDNNKVLETAGNGYVHVIGGADVRLTLGNEGDEGTNNSNWLRASVSQLMYNSAGGDHRWEVSGSQKMVLSSSGTLSGDLNDTSDEKRKKNITSIPDGAIANIKQLRPVTFNWKDPDNTDKKSGFIAQEIKTVIPDLVVGEEYDETNSRLGYAINTSGLVAHLTKALQEAITKIETLETKVAALEAA